MSPSKANAERVAESYYDSSDADNFYEKIWGGEDIHIGLYDEDGISIRDASHKTVELMTSKLEGINEDTHVMDLGAGYGGAARFLAKKFGCKVTCLNVSERQNERNRRLNEQQDLDDKIVVLHGSFEEIPHQKDKIDVIWSQDSFLHSGQRRKVLEEVDRVLRPGGELIFTDPMQADDCPEGVLQPVYDRLELQSLGSFAFYRQHLGELGFEEVECQELTHQLRNHYDTVRKELASRHKQLTDEIGTDYVERMLTGLKNWVEAADKGYLAWGILHFRKQ
ncbi:MAG: methyltransferase domain-containing protein [Pseudomonadales bacterium]|nr:methyltransferase domain-containing protein [Pseudomonadales bacterium]